MRFIRDPQGFDEKQDVSFFMGDYLSEMFLATLHLRL